MEFENLFNVPEEDKAKFDALVKELKTLARLPMEICVNHNPLASKGAMGVITGLGGGDIVRLCEHELIKGCEFNKTDIAFYVMALEALHQSLETMLDDTDKILLDELRKHGKVVTIDATKIKKTGGDNNEI